MLTRCDEIMGSVNNPLSIWEKQLSHQTTCAVFSSEVNLHVNCQPVQTSLFRVLDRIMQWKPINPELHVSNTLGSKMCQSLHGSGADPGERGVVHTL